MLTDTTAPGQTDHVSFDVHLEHPPEKVWRALTDPVLLNEWLLPAFDFKLQPGADFTLKTEPVGGWDGVVNCKMLEVDAPKKLSWRWVVGDIDTVLTFGLKPTPSGSHLSIVQSGFKPHQKQNAGGARYGWKMMGEKLIALLGRNP